MKKTKIFCYICLRKRELCGPSSRCMSLNTKQRILEYGRGYHKTHAKESNEASRALYKAMRPSAKSGKWCWFCNVHGSECNSRSACRTLPANERLLLYRKNYAEAKSIRQGGGPEKEKLKRLERGRILAEKKSGSLRKTWAREFLHHARRLILVEGVPGLEGYAPAKEGPLPGFVYGKAADMARTRPERECIARELRLKSAHLSIVKKAIGWSLSERSRRKVAARHDGLIAMKEQRSGQKEKHRRFLESLDGPGGPGRNVDMTDEQKKAHRRMYLRAYSCINETWRGVEKRAAGRELRPRRGPGVYKFYLEISNAEKVSCFYCEEPVARAEITVDHYMPLALGGAHVKENLVVSCWTCNSMKGGMNPIDFIECMKASRQ
jgi:5-methylcytosine-specific restriction endonuclease McrA